MPFSADFSAVIASGCSTFLHVNSRLNPIDPQAQLNCCPINDAFCSNRDPAQLCATETTVRYLSQTGVSPSDESGRVRPGVGAQFS